MKESTTDDKGRSSSSSRKGSGRKKISMKKIEKKTFSTLRPGLFKKDKELSFLCGADIDVITFSPGGKLFMFENPLAEAITKRYINSGGLVPGGQVRCRETLKRPEVVKEETTGGYQQGFGWEAPESELESMDLTELERYGVELEKFMNKLRFWVMMESGSDTAAGSGFNSNQPGTSSTVELANSDSLILQDLDKFRSWTRNP